MVTRMHLLLVFLQSRGLMRRMYVPAFYVPYNMGAGWRFSPLRCAAGRNAKWRLSLVCAPALQSITVRFSPSAKASLNRRSVRPRGSYTVDLGTRRTFAGSASHVGSEANDISVVLRGVVMEWKIVGASAIFVRLQNLHLRCLMKVYR